MTEATTKAIRNLPLPKRVEKLIAERAGAVIRIAEVDAMLPALQAELANIQAELDARKDIDTTGLPEGTKVAFAYGRGESRKELTGRVVAFAPKTGAVDSRYRIETGEGFDAVIVTVFSRDISATVSAI